MSPFAEVKCKRCKGSGEQPVYDEDGHLVRDLCGECGGCGVWEDIVSGPWQWLACGSGEESVSIRGMAWKPGEPHPWRVPWCWARDAEVRTDG